MQVRSPKPWITCSLVNTTFVFRRWLHSLKWGRTALGSFFFCGVDWGWQLLLTSHWLWPCSHHAVHVYLLAGEDDKLILCDECNKAFHLFCLRPALYEVPDGEWQCPACQPATARRNSRGRWELLLLKTNKLISSCCTWASVIQTEWCWGALSSSFVCWAPLFKVLQWVGEWCSEGSDLI